MGRLQQARSAEIFKPQRHCENGGNMPVGGGSLQVTACVPIVEDIDIGPTFGLASAKMAYQERTSRFIQG